MSDRIALIGKTLDFVIAFLETSNIPYQVTRMDDVPVRNLFWWKEGMIFLEVDDQIVTKVYMDGWIYEQGKEPVQNRSERL